MLRAVVCVCVCVCVCEGWTGTVTQEAGGAGEEGRKRRVARQAVPHEEVPQCHAYRWIHGDPVRESLWFHVEHDSTDLLAFLAVILRALASGSVCHVTEEDTRRETEGEVWVNTKPCTLSQDETPSIQHCLMVKPRLSSIVSWLSLIHI